MLDLARRYPGAYTTMFLSDFGAQVIKIDPPGPSIMAEIRNVPEERLAPFYALDRNKRSVVLDLKNPACREVFLRLAQRADVLVEGFRPGVTDRLGIGYKQLSELNPRLVYCSQSGFGQDGPYAGIPGHDANYLAMSGALSLIGERNGRPFLPSNLIADFAGAGLHSTIGVLLALMARERTGRGQYVDIAYLDTVVSLLAWQASMYFATGKLPKRGEDALTGAAPFYQVLRCKDGEYMTIGAAEPHLWVNLCKALGREDLIDGYLPETLEESDRIVAELAEVFATRTRDEWWTYLKDKNTCVGPVYNIDEALEDPQLRHREMVVEMDHPLVGKVTQTGIPIKLSETPGSIHRLGVPTGADTAAVLEELGYGEDEIQALRAQGALG